MKRQENLQCNFIVHESFDSLPANQIDLINTAIKQLEFTYAPYSNFHVGAALILENDEIVTGCNQENASYPLCTCGEHTAVVSAGSRFPGVKILSLAIVAKNPNNPLTKPVTPCGACRQIIAEFEVRQKAPIELLLYGESGDVYVFDSVKALLPLSFDRSVF